ncbi:hypothetical protein BDB01DRAFT_834104 [Pilobolus umbonatus]|nr:hypothetical protein BDB01DRAFT_834104 [Pilobolus umbonatus]
MPTETIMMMKFARVSYPYSYQYGSYGTAYNGYPQNHMYGNQIVSAYPQSNYYGGSMYASPYGGTAYYPKYNYTGANSSYYGVGNSYALHPYYNAQRHGTVRNFLHRIRHPHTSYYPQYYNNYPMGSYDYSGGYRRGWSEY